RLRMAAGLSERWLRRSQQLARTRCYLTRAHRLYLSLTKHQVVQQALVWQMDLVAWRQLLPMLEVYPATLPEPAKQPIVLSRRRTQPAIWRGRWHHAAPRGGYRVHPPVTPNRRRDGHLPE